jgi:putative ABC transport system ATP-binding protein
MQTSRRLAIKVENLDKSFDVSGQQVQVLKNVSFEIESFEFAIIYGPSGCGKSTLLHSLLGLEPPTGGRAIVLGNDIYTNYSEDKLSDFRKRNIGMVYQQSNWIKSISVLQNVALPLALLGEKRAPREEKARNMLEAMGMLDWADYIPSELSSGQQQKVSLCRALISNPSLIIADEPTGNLDFEAGENLMRMLKGFSERKERTIVMVTHDLNYLKYANKAINLFDGYVRKVYVPDQDTAEMEINRLAEKKNGNGL